MTLKCLTLPIARPMLKSASEFLNDSGRKAPVRMINKSFLFDCRIFSETIPLMYKNYLNSYFICFMNVVQKLLYYLPSRKFPVCMIVSVPWVTITLSALLWLKISQILSLETKHNSKGLH